MDDTTLLPHPHHFEWQHQHRVPATRYRAYANPRIGKTEVFRPTQQPKPPTAFGRQESTDEPVIILGMPTRTSISTDTFSALNQNHDGFRLLPITSVRMPIVQARNAIAKQMQAVAASFSSPVFCLWIDSDAWHPPKTIAQAVAILWNNPKIDLLAASFSTRLPFASRVAYRKEDDMHSYPRPQIDCQMSDLVTVESVGLHWVMHRPELLPRVGSNPFETEEGMGEDVAFCRRVRKAGASIVCAVGLLVAHVDVESGAAYIPGEPSMLIENNSLMRTGITHMVPKTADVRDYGLPAQVTQRATDLNPLPSLLSIKESIPK